MYQPTGLEKTQYEDLLAHTFYNGVDKEDRTGTGTRAYFGGTLRYDLSNNVLPVITTKKVHLHSVFVELLWFLKGFTNTQYLRDNGVTIWDEWADVDGELGPVYGSQWRNWQGPNGAIDQIAILQDKLRNNPDDRGMVVSAWNVGALPDMALRPCHYAFEVYTELLQGQRYLSLKVNQRSADLFLGVPFNISSYAALAHMLANSTGMKAKTLLWTGTDCHVYKNHFEQVKLQLSRVKQAYDFPTISFASKPENVWDYELADIEVHNYQFHSGIKAPVAV